MDKPLKAVISVSVVKLCYCCPLNTKVPGSVCVENIVRAVRAVQFLVYFTQNYKAQPRTVNLKRN